MKWPKSSKYERQDCKAINMHSVQKHAKKATPERNIVVTWSIALPNLFVSKNNKALCHLIS